MNQGKGWARVATGTSAGSMEYSGILADVLVLNLSRLAQARIQLAWEHIQGKEV